ncbi:STAS/SEC14 domain-containing protein [uncultured Pelagimonas sp.]|uniref:STAS/SEC14 domain-containing protein n=1 Tax=uncultured Pelagimonas sp. TaxID=1618102 RepID=UPI0026208A99|nr:STAS/SEC14 domain-containing protein [uncultured Pelagimonas sp.]
MPNVPMAYAEFPERRTIEITVRGALCREDYASIMMPMAGFIEAQGSIQVIEIIDSFAGFDEQIATEPGPADGGLLAHIDRVAIVSDIGWYCPIISAAPSTLGIRMKSFKRAELEEARRWVLDR